MKVILGLALEEAISWLYVLKLLGKNAKLVFFFFFLALYAAFTDKDEFGLKWRDVH